MDVGAGAANHPRPSSGATDPDLMSGMWTLVEQAVVLSPRGEQGVQHLRESLLEAMAASPRGITGLLVDATDWRFLEHQSGTGIRAIASVWVELSSGFGHRLALVGPGDLQFGLLRIAGAHAELHGVTAEVFRRGEDAMHWLASA